MSENILVSVAWPYANADIHVGNIVGAYLPADIFARYHRLRGNNVLMVSGSLDVLNGRAAELERFEILVKPFKVHELVQKVRTLLNRAPHVPV